MSTNKTAPPAGIKAGTVHVDLPPDLREQLRVAARQYGPLAGMTVKQAENWIVNRALEIALPQFLATEKDIRL